MTATTLLLVVGPGRSGTSTLAGALSMLGAHVPGPYLDANRTNPKGFFESRWSVDFHNAILRRAHLGLVDARPEGAQIFRKRVTAADRERLAQWLTEQRDGPDPMVLKDPRVVWSIPTFTRVADELGLRLVAAVTLRHPAEVIASRLDYYRRPNAALDVPGYQTRDLAGWLNMLTICEQETRGLARSFVGYHDLLTDWRSALAPALQGMEVSLPVPDAAEHHEIDDFIDPGLNRHQADWSHSSVPAELQDLSQRAWDLCLTLAEGDRDDAARAGLDEVRAEYARLYHAARALVHDEFVAVAGAAKDQPKPKAKPKPTPKPKPAPAAEATEQSKQPKQPKPKPRPAGQQRSTSKAAEAPSPTTTAEPDPAPQASTPLARAASRLGARHWPRWARTVTNRRGSTR